MPCNWKVALEAFIESYHTMAVHPQLLPTPADSLTEYDVYGSHVSRMINPVGVSSEHLGRQLDDGEIIRAMLGAEDAEVTVEPGSNAAKGARRAGAGVAAASAPAATTPTSPTPSSSTASSTSSSRTSCRGPGS